ncbi:MAG: helix-turn-helix domain-containing protein [Candidatus Nezhaarchaeales archaeon]
MPGRAENPVLRESIRILKESGFKVSVLLNDRRSSFDLMARRGSSLLITKAVEELDEVPEEVSRELKRMASALSATSLIIASRKGGEDIEEDLAYDKMGIWAVAPATLSKAIRGEGPLVYSKLGRFYVNIDGGRLREARERRQLSLGSLARLVGVSRRAIYEYERGSMDSTLEVAIRMEEVLEQGLAVPINILAPAPLNASYTHRPGGSLDPLERGVALKFKVMGFKVFHFKRAPFDIIARGRRSRLLVKVARHLDHQFKRRLRVMRSLADVSDSLSFIVVRDGDSAGEGGVVPYEELERVRNEDELVSMVSSS